MQKNHSKFKKLYQFILAAAMFGCVSAYAAPSADENGVLTQAPVMATSSKAIDNSSNEGKEGMAWREKKDAAVKGEGLKSAPYEPSILFVCGGNTGRSFAAEKWTRFSKYGRKVDAFSRGSGITAEDSLTPEEPMVDLLLADKRIPAYNKDRLHNAIKFHRATPASTMDIYNADIVLAMTKSHKQRLFDLIDHECTSANLDAKKLDTRTRNKWDTACLNTDALKRKIHTLIGCATGTDGDIADGYGTPLEDEAKVYPPIYKDITSNIKTILDNTTNPAVNTYQKPAHGMMGLSYHPPIYCKE